MTLLRRLLSLFRRNRYWDVVRVRNMTKTPITKDWIATQRARAEMAEFVDTVTFIEALDALEEAMRENERLSKTTSQCLVTQEELDTGDRLLAKIFSANQSE